MTRAAPIVATLLAAGLAATACRPRPTAGPSGVRTEATADPLTSRLELRRDLEATVLEGYLQLSLGNLEAYGDGIARDRDIALIGLSPQAVVVGRDPAAVTADRRPFPNTAARFFSRNLNLGLAPDLSVGWGYDELSYRVDHFGREVSVPLRVSTVYQREVDRWVLVFEHVGYALPIEDIIELARAGRLAAPTPVCRRKKCDNESPGLRRIVEALYSDQPGGGIEANFVDGTRAARAAVLVWPDPDQEHHGSDVEGAPELAELFGPGSRVRVRDYYAFVGPNRKVAWVAANLEVQTGDGELRIGLRGSHVLEVVRVGANQYSWKIVQVQVSVPLSESELRRRAFGEP